MTAGRVLTGYRILGPLEVTVGGAPAELGPPKQRAVLAMLLLGAGRAVPVRRLIDGLWPAGPPRSAIKNVHVYVYQLRKVVHGLTSVGTGYALDAGADLDLARFRELVFAAREARRVGAMEGAVRAYREALALWRGPALADLVGRDLLTAQAEHLEQLRLRALDECLGLQFDLGRHREVLGELARLIAEFPLDEALRRHQIRALHALGRDAEAAAAYREACRVLAQELGVRPGAALRGTGRCVHCGQPMLPPNPPARCDTDRTR